MIWYRQVGVIVLAALAVSGVVVWADVTDRYVAATELRLRVGDSIGYDAIHIPPIMDGDESVTVGVLFSIANPTGVGLQITQIAYQFYMDNLTDTRAFLEKADSIFVGRGGYFSQENPATFPARSTGNIWVNLTIEGDLQPVALSRLNLTFNGRYYPIIITEFVYRVQGTTVVDREVGIVFSTNSGLEPYEG
jgi:hypothetical protein